MKTSWIIGVVTIWLILFVLCMIVEDTTAMGSSDMSMLQSLVQPKGTDFSNIVSGAISLVTDVWQYFTLLIQLIFLWFPSMWDGVYIWFWLFICLPIGIGMVASIVTVIRGSSSS
jgi:hypothetical protein